jgi:hypothetical protein
MCRIQAFFHPISDRFLTGRQFETPALILYCTRKVVSLLVVKQVASSRHIYLGSHVFKARKWLYLYSETGEVLYNKLTRNDNRFL